MDCQEFLQRYSEYDDSLLDAAELERFRSHMGGCLSCARYDRVLRKGRMLVRQLPPPEPERDFVLRLQHHLWTERHARRRRSAPPVLGGAAAALAAVTITLSTLWSISLMDQGGMAVDAAAMAPRSQVTPVATTAPLGARAPWSGVHSGSVTGGGWAAERVDRRGPASYSPLVTGPPAYRAAGAVFVSSTAITGQALD